MAESEEEELAIAPSVSDSGGGGSGGGGGDSPDSSSGGGGGNAESGNQKVSLPKPDAVALAEQQTQQTSATVFRTTVTAATEQQRQEKVFKSSSADDAHSSMFDECHEFSSTNESRITKSSKVKSISTSAVYAGGVGVGIGASLRPLLGFASGSGIGRNRSADSQDTNSSVDIVEIVPEEAISANSLGEPKRYRTTTTLELSPRPSWRDKSSSSRESREEVSRSTIDEQDSSFDLDDKVLGKSSSGSSPRPVGDQEIFYREKHDATAKIMSSINMNEGKYEKEKLGFSLSRAGGATVYGCSVTSENSTSSEASASCFQEEKIGGVVKQRSAESIGTAERSERTFGPSHRGYSYQEEHSASRTTSAKAMMSMLGQETRKQWLTTDCGSTNVNSRSMESLRNHEQRSCFVTNSERELRRVVSTSVEARSLESLEKEIRMMGNRFRRTISGEDSIDESIAERKRGLFASSSRRVPSHLSLMPPGDHRRLTILSPHSPMIQQLPVPGSSAECWQFTTQTVKTSRRKAGIVLPRLVLPGSCEFDISTE